MKLPWPAVAAGVLALAVGGAGLVRGAMPQSAASGGSGPSQPVSVYGAYLRPPVPPTERAAAYFTIRNNTGTPDVLTDVDSGAGGSNTLHQDQGGRMVALATGLTIPAGKTVVMTPGGVHVMIEQIYGTLEKGDNVTFQLTFRNAGTVEITTPVVPFGQPAPTASGVPK
ncbi:copper chaperone PCu(A)C [Jatrophihabitans fulvus]